MAFGNEGPTAWALGPTGNPGAAEAVLGAQSIRLAFRV